MCTYLTEKIDVDGSGKGATGWFAASQATVYVDHPVHAPYGHTVNIDVLNPALGPSARVALELTEFLLEIVLLFVDALRLLAPLLTVSGEAVDAVGDLLLLTRQFLGALLCVADVPLRAIAQRPFELPLRFTQTIERLLRL